MRQPEVGRLLGLLLALLLVAPVGRAAAHGVHAGAFLVEFVSGAGYRPLSALTRRPLRRPLPVEGARADLWSDRGPRGRPLVLVHGYAPRGKNDPDVRRAAALLARAGFDVAVPTVPGLARARLRPADVETVVATIAARAGPTVVIGVSVGAGPALVAAADPRVRDRVHAVVSLGGYASASELVRHYLSSRAAHGGEPAQAAMATTAVETFLRANRDLLDDSARRLLAATDAAGADDALARLSPELRALLDALSPARVAADIPGRLVLVHGRLDPAVPYTEALRLAAARPRRTTVTLVTVLDHVEGAPVSVWSAARDLLALWRIAYGLVAG